MLCHTHGPNAACCTPANLKPTHWWVVCPMPFSPVILLYVVASAYWRMVLLVTLSFEKKKKNNKFLNKRILMRFPPPPPFSKYMLPFRLNFFFCPVPFALLRPFGNSTNDYRGSYKNLSKLFIDPTSCCCLCYCHRQEKTWQKTICMHAHQSRSSFANI